MSLQHLHLYVRNRASAEQFYAEWFGMRIQHRGSDTTVLVDDRDFFLALSDDPSPQTSSMHFGFKLGSAAEVLSLNERMRHAEVEIRKTLYQDESFVTYRCADPDGYLMDVFWQAQNK